MFIFVRKKRKYMPYILCSAKNHGERVKSLKKKSKLEDWLNYNIFRRFYIKMFVTNGLKFWMCNYVLWLSRTNDKLKIRVSICHAKKAIFILLSLSLPLSILCFYFSLLHFDVSYEFQIDMCHEALQKTVLCKNMIKI